MEGENSSIGINLFLKGIGRKISLMEQEEEYLQMVKCTRESGSMEICKEKEFSSNKTVLRIQDNG